MEWLKKKKTRIQREQRWAGNNLDSYMVSNYIVSTISIL